MAYSERQREFTNVSSRSLTSNTTNSHINLPCGKSYSYRHACHSQNNSAVSRICFALNNSTLSRPKPSFKLSYTLLNTLHNHACTWTTSSSNTPPEPFSDVPCWRRGYRLARPLPARQGLSRSGAMGVAFYVP